MTAESLFNGTAGIMTRREFDEAFTAVAAQLITQMQSTKAISGQVSIYLQTYNRLSNCTEKYLLTRLSKKKETCKSFWHSEAAGVLITEKDNGGDSYYFIAYSDITAVVGRIAGPIAGYR